MKYVAIVSLLACAGSLIGCETTQTAQGGNQEAKRMAALQRQRQEEQIAESDRNLWNTQRDILLRDGNPARNYY